MPHMQRSLMIPEHPYDLHHHPGASSLGQQQLHPDIDGVDPANGPDEVWHDAIDKFEPSFARGRINKKTKDKIIAHTRELGNIFYDALKRAIRTTNHTV